MVRIVYTAFAATTALALLLFPETAALAVTDSLEFCFYTLIPAMFPFFVLCGILVSCGVGEAFERVFGGGFNKLFGVRGCGAAAFFIGALCGFPAGAKTISEFCESSRRRGYGLSYAEAEKMLAFCCNCGPAYLIAGVGSALFDDPVTGVKLWLAQLASAVISGIVLRGKVSSGKSEPPPVLKLSGKVPATAVVSSLRSACTSVALVCGTVVFFSVLCRFAAVVLSPLPAVLRCTLLSLIEMTGGIRNAAEALPRGQALLICGFACGWSGISVHIQTAAVTGGKLRLGKYMLGKLICGILTAVFALFI